MKSPAERGRIGAWAYEARADADLSVEEVAERLARAGQPVQPSTIRGIEGGSKKPSRRLLRAMAQVYGKTAPGDDTGGENGEFAALIASIGELVHQVEAERAERRRWELGWISTLRAALAGQVPAELLDALVPPPPGDIRP